LQGKKNEDFIKFIPKYSLVLCMGVEMGKEKLQQILPTFLFNMITRVEREDDLHKEVEDINENVK